MGVIAPAQRLMALAAELGLTEMQRRFCELLSGDQDRNQTKAAEGAGCGKGAHVTASKWLRLAKVKAYLAGLDEVARAMAEKRTGRRILAASEVLELLSDHATADMAEYVTVTNPPTLAEQAPHEQKGEEPVGPTWCIDIPKAIANGKSHLIKEISYDSNGLPKLKLVDSQGALDKLAKYHGLYKADEGSAPSVNVTLVQVLQQDPRLAVEMAKALLSAGPKEVEGKRVG